MAHRHGLGQLQVDRLRELESPPLGPGPSNSGPPQSPSTGGELGTGPLLTVTPSGMLTSTAKLIAALIDKTVAYLDLPALKPALKVQLVARKPAAACNALKLYVAAVKAAPARAHGRREDRARSGRNPHPDGARLHKAAERGSATRP